MSNNNDTFRSITEADEVSLKELLIKIREWVKYLWSKKWIVIIAGLVGGILGLAYSYTKKPIYTATTTFVLEEGDGGGGLSQYAGVAAIVGLDLGSGGGLFQGENIIELYRSRNMLQRALLSSENFGNKKQLLVDRYLEINNIREKWKNPKLKTLSFSDSMKFSVLQDSVIREVVKDIKDNYLFVSKPDKKLSILRVDVKSIDEDFSKKFNEQIVSTVNRFYIDTKTKKSVDNIRILQRQTDSVRQVISGAIYSAASTVDATPNLNVARQVLRAPSQRSQMDAQANQPLLSELVKQLELSKIMYRKDMPLIQVVDHPIYPLDKYQLGKTKGMVIGGVVAAFSLILLLIFRKIYIQLINE